jgi:flagellar hook assembly protein FlgD
MHRATIVLALAAATLCAAASPAGAQATWSTPPINLLYQNFPNPFPSTTSPVTCIWFDLAQRAGDVKLAIYDVRGRLIRTLIPSATVSGTLDAGYYGRAGSGPLASGCDPRFSWDGRGSDGATVPPGVYLVRLHADDAWQTKKIIFRGP